MRFERSIATLALSVALSGCAPTVDVTTGAIGDYGAGPLPADYRKIVKEHVRNSFYDPYSIRDAQIAAPKMSSAPVLIPNSLGIGGTFTHVWVVCLRANAKNRMGAYIGMTPTAVFITNNKVANTVGGAESGAAHMWCDGSAYEPFPEVSA